MRKSILLPIVLLVLITTGCSTTQHKAQSTASPNQATTQKVLTDSAKTWTLVQKVVSKQTDDGPDDNLKTATPTNLDKTTKWTTNKGRLTSANHQYKQISLKQWEKQSKKTQLKPLQKYYHLMTVNQVNATLKQLGANFEIKQLSELIFLNGQTDATVFPQALIAKGHHLYAINMQYMTNGLYTTLDRGQVMTDITPKPKAKPAALPSLNGTWVAAKTTASANDSGQLLIKDGYLYQKRYDSYERSAIQSLTNYSKKTLKQNPIYPTQQAAATKAGYQLTAKSIASGDSVGYLYLFINDKQLVRIGEGIATQYDKTSPQVTTSDLPETNITIFEQMDTQNPGEVASTITTKASAPIVGLSASINYLTDSTAGQITDNRGVDIVNGEVVMD